MKIKEITYSSFNNKIKSDFYAIIFFDSSFKSKSFLEVIGNVVALLRNEDFTLFLCNGDLFENFSLLEVMKCGVTPSLFLMKKDEKVFSDEECDENEDYYYRKIIEIKDL